MPLHVSSTMCSSSGGQNCIIQLLVSSQIGELCITGPLHSFVPPIFDPTWTEDRWYKAVEWVGYAGLAYL